MKWLEIIELRSAGKHQAQIEQGLADLTTGADPEIKPWEIKVYTHVSVPTDFSVHLLHDSKEVDINGSPLGLRLTSALKEFGLVNHGVWVEK